VTYPNTSDFTAREAASAYWFATYENRRLKFMWDGWSVVALMRTILLNYLTSAQVRISQGTLGATTPQALMWSYPFQVLARHFLNSYSGVPGVNTAMRFDSAADWQGLDVTPWQVTLDASGQQRFSRDLIRGIYALVQRLSVTGTNASMRIMNALPDDWESALQRAGDGATNRSTMLVIVVLATANLLGGTLEGPLEVDLPADTTPLVVNQEPKRPAAPTSASIIDITDPALPRPFTPGSMDATIPGTIPGSLDPTPTPVTPQPVIPQPGTTPPTLVHQPAAGRTMSTGAAVMLVGVSVGAATGIWWLLRRPTKAHGKGKARGNPVEGYPFDRSWRV